MGVVAYERFPAIWGGLGSPARDGLTFHPGRVTTYENRIERYCSPRILHLTDKDRLL